MSPTLTTLTTPEFEVHKSGLAGLTWTVVCRGDENKAREIFQRQLRLYSVGRFRLVDQAGRIVEDRKALPLFHREPEATSLECAVGQAQI